jgi:hypothetical protein
MEEILERIFPNLSLKESSRSSIINSKFLENVEKTSSIEAFHVQSASCKENIERIQLANKYFEWTPLQPEIIASKSIVT